jgi:hypothetical protein
MKMVPVDIEKSATPIVILWAAICAYLLWQGWGAVAAGFGDSDDAVRLVLVRELAAGRGWYDQKVLRIEPPQGFWLHWSRLLDGALALPLWGLSRLIGQARAEFWLRLLWPLTLLPPIFLSTRHIISRLNPDPTRRSAAIAAAAMILLFCLPLYAQFHPGRIDHHNVQILLWLVAVAGAVGQGRGGAAIAGASIGLGLAIGIEAIVLEAAVAAYMAVMMLVRPDQSGRARAFALALGASVCAAFLVQTPPQRWDVSACDALGLNMTLGVAIGSMLMVAASFRPRPLERAGWMLAAAGLAGATFFAMHPSCVRGPYADVDPRIYLVWLRNVQETKSIPQLLHGDFATGLTLLVAVIYAPAAWLALGLWPSIRARPAYYLTGAMVVIAAVSTFAMLRMSSYLMWAAVPTSATLAALVAQKLSRTTPAPLVRTLLFGLLLAPNLPASAIIAASRLNSGRGAAATSGPEGAGVMPDQCFSAEAYQDLARLHPGVVASETDLGAFVLAYTPSAVLSAPYHRADRGILAANALLSAPAQTSAWALAKAAEVKYILVCPAHAARDDAQFAPTSLRKTLDAGATPTWLTRISAPNRPLQIFQVRP